MIAMNFDVFTAPSAQLKCRRLFYYWWKIPTSNIVDDESIGHTRTNHVPVEWKSSCTHDVRREVTIHWNNVSLWNDCNSQSFVEIFHMENNQFFLVKSNVFDSTLFVARISSHAYMCWSFGKRRNALIWAIVSFCKFLIDWNNWIELNGMTENEQNWSFS